MDKILVVDDELDISNLAKLILEDSGYKVITASNAGEAIIKAETELPDLILLDVVLPGKNGFEVCKILKFQPKTQFIPIVMFTTLGREVDRRYSQEVGADGHFVKSFTPESLLAEVKKHLEKYRPNKFSGQLGVDHGELMGKKILLEFDPSIPYERFVRDFAIESAFHNEEVIVFTQKESIVQQALKGDEGIKFNDIRSQEGLYTRARGLLEDRSRSMSIIYDNLTDTIVSSDFQSTYNFIKNTLRQLPKPGTTALFLLNASAHDLREVYGLKGLFTSQITFNKEGIINIKIA
jgi:DNA-binding response OmpR family regulator